MKIMAGLRSFAVVFILVLVTCSVQVPASDTTLPPLANGLSSSFYQVSCPAAQSIIRADLWRFVIEDNSLAAGFLELHFHDCFVQGCDGSVLLDGSTSGPREKDTPPNLHLRGMIFQIVEYFRRRIEEQCGRVVSCADIVAILARDSVVLLGGPDYPVQLGRRDGLTFAAQEAVLANLPPPSTNASTIVDKFAKKGLDITDVVALSGAHTIGTGHCSSFVSRIYPMQDPAMDKSFANKLKNICPTATSDASTSIDIRTPFRFDNRYYVGLMNRQGLFTSDQDLYSYHKTKGIVTSFAVNQSLFFEKFSEGMIKMGQIGVLTGEEGEIRANCYARNSDNKSPDYLATLPDNLETLSAVF